MITKNEFYGAYILQAKVADDKALSVNDLFNEIERAWGVVESLQAVPIMTFVTDDDVKELVKKTFPDTYTKDTPIIQEVTSTCLSGLPKTPYDVEDHND